MDAFSYLVTFISLIPALALTRVLVGLKMVWLNDLYGGKFPISLSLGIITGVIAVSVLVSLAFPKAPPESEGLSS